MGIRDGVFCKHYEGMGGKDTCEAGVKFSSLPHYGSREFHEACPCFRKKAAANCVKAEYPTAQEIEARDAMIAALIERVATARKAIVDHLGGPWEEGLPSVAGAIDCPICNGKQTLRFRRAGINGHIHAGCSSGNCVAWME